jgi:hypothetical protein
MRTPGVLDDSSRYALIVRGISAELYPPKEAYVGAEEPSGSSLAIDWVYLKFAMCELWRSFMLLSPRNSVRGIDEGNGWWKRSWEVGYPFEPRNWPLQESSNRRKSPGGPSDSGEARTPAAEDEDGGRVAIETAGYGSGGSC